MTKKKKTFRKFINEEILKIEPPKKGKEFGSFKEFVNDVKGYQPPEKPELQTETFKEFVDKTKGPEKNFVPDYINPTQKQIEEINKRRIIEEINEVLKYRDPVLNKMSFQEWLKIPQNFFVFELSNEQAKRLYEQDMSRVEKYEEINKKSGKGRNKVAATSTEPTFDPKTIASLVAWYDAADSDTIDKDGNDLVSQWDDKSGNGFHAIGFIGTKPKYFASGGGIGQAHLNWGHDHPTRSSLSVSGPTTWAPLSSGGYANTSVFAVLHWPGTQTGNVSDLIRWDNNNAFGIHKVHSSRNGSVIYRGGWQCKGGTPANLLPSKFLTAWMYTDSGFVTRLNGAVDDTDSTSPGTNALTDSNWVIGSNVGNGSHLEVSEILIFNTEITGDDLSDVENYLNTKWSIY